MLRESGKRQEHGACFSGSWEDPGALGAGDPVHICGGSPEIRGPPPFSHARNEGDLTA